MEFAYDFSYNDKRMRTSSEYRCAYFSLSITSCMVNRFAIHIGVPSIAGPPSLKNDPPDRFIRFTPAELLKFRDVSCFAKHDQRLCLWKLQAFEKA